jgi:uncharacterized protein YggE
MNILGTKTEKAIVSVLGVLSLFLVFKCVTEVKRWSTIGSDSSKIVTVSGTGDVFAVPNIANISVSINETGKTQSEAQSKATEKEAAILKYLKSVDIEDKDIKTVSYSVNPQYDYNTPAIGRPCPAIYPSNCPPVSNPAIVGYEAVETISVKVRDTSKSGDVVAGLGKAGAKNINGPSLENDDEDALRDQARAKAISNAKAKAADLAKQLGVRLGKLVSFNESGNGYVTPMYAKAGMGVSADAESTPSIPKGQNKISDTVTLTYEIR